MRILLLIALLSPPQAPLSISVSHWSGGVQIDVRVERNANNRSLAISWQNVDTYTGGATQRELAGEEAPLVTSIPLRIPSGHWLVVAATFDKSGKLLHREEREFFL